MKTLDSKNFFSIKDKDCFDNQMIRFVISNKKFLIPDLYSSFKSIYLQDREKKINNSSDSQDDWELDN